MIIIHIFIKNKAINNIMSNTLEKHLNEFIGIWDKYHKHIVFLSSSERNMYFDLIEEIKTKSPKTLDTCDKYLILQRIIHDIFSFCELPSEIDYCYHLEKCLKILTDIESMKNEMNYLI